MLLSLSLFSSLSLSSSLLCLAAVFFSLIFPNGNLERSSSAGKRTVWRRRREGERRVERERERERESVDDECRGERGVEKGRYCSKGQPGVEEIERDRDRDRDREREREREIL